MNLYKVWLVISAFLKKVLQNDSLLQYMATVWSDEP